MKWVLLICVALMFCSDVSYWHDLTPDLSHVDNHGLCLFCCKKTLIYQRKISKPSGRQCDNGGDHEANNLYTLIVVKHINRSQVQSI